MRRETLGIYPLTLTYSFFNIFYPDVAKTLDQIHLNALLIEVVLLVSPSQKYEQRKSVFN